MMNRAGDKEMQQRKDKRGRTGEQPPSHSQLISFQGVGSWCFLIFQMQNKVQDITHVYSSPSAEWPRTGRYRKALSHWSRASLPSYKSSYKNHLQNQLRCCPYGCEFNKDKPHLLTAACSLGFNASPFFFFNSLPMYLSSLFLSLTKSTVSA